MKSINTTLLFISFLAVMACVPTPNSDQKSDIEFEEKTTAPSPNAGPTTPTVVVPPTGSSYDAEASQELFRTTAFPVIRQGKCIECHSTTGTTTVQSPYFADADYKAAWDAAVNTGKLNWDNPDQSRILVRALVERHNCGDTNRCNTWSANLLPQIEAWAAAERQLRAASTSGYETIPRSFTQAQNDSRWAQTEDGLVVLQAEGGELKGRMRVFQDALALGGYIGGFTLPNHPFDNTERTGANTVSCSTNYDLSSGTNGPFQAQEVRRHINQNGHLMYSVQVAATLIRPDKRNEYLEMLKSGDFSNIDDVILRNGSTRTDANGNITSVDGDPVGFNLYRALPELRAWEEFVPNIRTNPEMVEFFSPRFNGNQYYTGETSLLELIRKVPDRYRQQIAMRALYRQWRGEYYRNVDRDNESLRTNFSDRIPFVRSQTSSLWDTFEESWGDLTYENALDIVHQETDGNGNVTKVIRKIDTYLIWRVTNNGRQANQDVQLIFYDNNRQETTRENYDLTLGNTNTDLTDIYVGEGGASQVLIDNESKAAFANTMYPIFRSNSCVNCHGDGSGRPQFAQANSEAGWQVMMDSGFINFAAPRSSRPVERVLDDRHNCGDTTLCDAIGASFLTAINTWKTQVETFQANLGDSGNLAYSEEDRKPAHALYRVNIREPGRYNLWFKAKSTNNASDTHFFRLRDSNGNIIRDSDNSNCRLYDLGDLNSWTWITNNRANPENRRFYNITQPGVYTLEYHEGRDGGQVDLIALSKNPEFAPHERIIDEGYISAQRPNILRYDLSSVVGKPAWFEAELIDLTQESWELRSPRIISPETNVKVKNIKVKVNGQFEFNNATWTKIDRVVGSDGILTRAPLVALKINGSADSFTFIFEDLQASELDATPAEDDAPLPVEGRKCLAIDQFVRTVEPIINDVSLVFKGEDDEDGYADIVRQFPGTRRRGIDNFQVYNCTTCHNEEHPYFKMTTFLDPNEADPHKRFGDLCSQAISRVDFTNVRSSRFIRGINGTHNHPKLHFAEEMNLNGAQTDWIRDGNNELATTWLGVKYDRYTTNDLNLNAYSGADREYLESFVGMPKQFSYRQYSGPAWDSNYNLVDPNDNQSDIIGEIMTDDDNLDPAVPYYNANGNENRPGRGDNLYQVADPRNFLANKDGLSPRPYTGNNRNNFRHKNLVINRGNNGTERFESVKDKYREAVIRWMEAEKSALEALINGQ